VYGVEVIFLLDERKIKVLCAVIDSYIRGAEPVGSRTISKEYNLGISSATIRNEMSDLEELGYLSKPHISSGRVPSDKAYRFYVNNIIMKNQIKIDMKKKEEIKKLLTKESKEIDELIQNSAKILSAITSYTALAVSPRIRNMKLKHIQLVSLDDNQILIILVGNSGIVKNIIFRTEQIVPEYQLERVSNFLNKKLKGFTVNEIGRSIEYDILKEMHQYKRFIDKVILEMVNSFEDYNDVEVYADGVTNIFDFPEYKDADKAKTFISFIEDKDQLIELLLKHSLNSEIEITIGSENIYEEIKDCSLITTTYKLGDKIIGKIGVIGPTRMDYMMAVSSLKLFSENLSEILEKLLIG
jgi:heat-inducible transcriptional repressor